MLICNGAGFIPSENELDVLRGCGAVRLLAHRIYTQLVKDLRWDGTEEEVMSRISTGNV